ncbi:MAG: FAD-binding protein [Planctomycetota bacterium]|nr:FAD-binding protein [Planctomycetota bacterium]
MADAPSTSSNSTPPGDAPKPAEPAKAPAAAPAAAPKPAAAVPKPAAAAPKPALAPGKTAIALQPNSDTWPDEAPRVMDITTSNIASELRNMIRGEVRDDPFTLTMYSTDASIYEIEPFVVVYPRDEEDVRACVWFARKHNVPIIARGAGSGLTGECLGRAIVLDMNIHMARIIELDRQNQTVAVESGVVLDSLNRALKPYGFRVGPDPASSGRCTIGGMIANNSCGARSLKYGSMRDNLVSCRVVLSDGTVTNFRSVVRGAGDHERKKKEEGLAGRVHAQLPDLCAAGKDVIKKGSQKIRAERNRSGYLLDGVNGVEHFHPQRLICASEGTLGIVTEAIVRVVPLPGMTGMATVCFANLVDAAKAVPAIRETRPSACELLDKTIMAHARQALPEAAPLLPESAGAILIVEYESESRDGIEAKLLALEDRLKQGVAHQACKTLLDKGDQAKVWEARKAATPLLFRREDGLQPIPIVEDACVPVDKLAEYVEKMIKVFEKYKLAYTCYAHAGHGEPHFRPMMDLTKKEHVDLLEKIAGDCHAIVWACEGTISGEHGEGLARAQWIEKQAGKELYEIFKQVKELFDPAGILNPNKKITKDAHLMVKNLRFGADYRLSEGERPRGSHINPTQAVNYRMFRQQTAVWKEMTVEGVADNPDLVHQHGSSMLHWTAGEMAAETGKCNGNGHCRSTGPEVAMCPRFKYNRIEDASPRAKANVLRRLMNGRQRTGAFNAQEVVEIMDYCFNCKRCVDECPSAVNIPKIAMEAKARHLASNGLSLDKKFFVNIEKLFRAGRALAPIANSLTEFTVFRLLLEAATGIDRRRELPKFKSLRLRHRLTFSPEGPRPKVVVYADLVPKYNKPELLQAAVDVLEHNGYEVLVPEAPWCNMPAITHGAALDARANIREVAAALGSYAFRGWPILCLEPTATLALTKDFLYYVDTPETRAIARHTRDLGEFLLGLHKQKRLKTDFQRVDRSLAYLTPCHLKALGVGKPAVELLKLVPGVKIQNLDDKICCGMAGEFGMLKKNYDESMWIGRNLFRQAAECGAEEGCCESSGCSMQLEHGAGKATLHPIAILAQAYGYAAPEARTFIPDGLASAQEDPHADHDHGHETADENASHGESPKHEEHAHAGHH